MEQDMEMLIMNLIVDAGSARSHAMQAIMLAKENDFDGAQKALAGANEELGKVHNVQTDLIQNEAKGNHTQINLFMVHAQDHIMNAMVVRDMASEFVELYKKVNA